MFEQEIELEKKQSGAIPLLLIAGVIIAFIAVVTYFVVQSRKVLTNAEAAQVVNAILDAQPTTVSFHTGLVEDRFDENASDARYKLLENVGIVTIGKTKGERTPIQLTAKGEEILSKIAGVKKSKDDDGNDAYVVPLATRKLVSISTVTMNGPERAVIEYSWKWQTNPLGDYFDASSEKFSSLSSSDRTTLIDKFGARFYQEPPTKTTVAMAKMAQGWQTLTQ